MRSARLNRRLLVVMSLAGLMAYGDGAGVETVSFWIAAGVLLLALVWQPRPKVSNRMERIWLPLAFLLAVRALAHGFLFRDDVVVPVVDLLLFLLAAESLRSLDAPNDARLYSLSFALLLASTAYRPGLLFLVSFVIYVALGTLSLVVGDLRRQAAAHGVEETSLPRRHLLGIVALSGVTLAFSAAVFLFFPRASQGWAGPGQTMATSIAGFSDVVSLGTHGTRIYGNPQIVLRVEFPDGPPRAVRSLYWRGRSYDHFDGVRWSRSSRMTLSSAPAGWYARWGGESLKQRIYGAPLDSRVLFAVHPLLRIHPDSPIQPIFDSAGDLLFRGSTVPVYTVESVISRPTEETLRQAKGGTTPPGTSYLPRASYLQLPDLSNEVLDLADSLLADLPTDYDRVDRLKRWFQDEFSYTLALPANPAEATLENFLLRRRAGHCEYFSTATAVLLRTQGIPTREVNGFLGGEWSEFGNYLAVTQNQAHAWVEVWFPQVGWVPFDPTPSRSVEGSSPSVWFWPGRLAVDAIQHYWNKWILDYSVETQSSFLLRGGAALRRALTPTRGTSGSQEARFPWGRLVWALGAVAIVAMAAVAGTRRRHPVETRLFLRLRRLVRRAGAPADATRSPMALVGYLQAHGHPAETHARRVVEAYHRARFSGMPAGSPGGRDSAESLRRAVALLRDRPLSNRPAEADPHEKPPI